MRHVARKLYAGDTFDPARFGNEFDAVVTLEEEKHPSTTHYHPIKDSDKHEEKNMQEAVEEVVSLLEDDQEVLVHCSAGISRSTCVAAAACSICFDKDWQDSYEEAKCGMTDAKPSLKETSKEISKD